MNGRELIAMCNLEIYCPLWLQFGVYIILFNLCRFCENKLSEGHPPPPPRDPYFDVVGLAW
jgi:hypothetical protein